MAASNLEKDILRIAKASIEESITSALSGYNGPLKELTQQVINKNAETLNALINDEFVSLLDSQEFRRALGEALHAKLAKTLVSRMGGELEKRVNELQQNPTTRAALTLAVDRVIKESQ